ncbi:MAG TPA: hypothetical protein VFQ91_19430 [Bryobacteraceae bacterium]|nr:hypothetical protein [Bryobacteraceae bacterium]
MRIYSVHAVAVTVLETNPLRLLLEAQGLAATGGWTNPRLDSAADPNPADAILEFSFEADRPGGIVPQVLTPISASLTIEPRNGADAVVVHARTNSVTIHASQFVPVRPQHPAPITTLAVGEEEPRFTTLALGEEQPPITHWWPGWEQPTTMALGEEGPITNPRLDDPAGPFGRF